MRYTRSQDSRLRASIDRNGSERVFEELPDLYAEDD